MVAIDHFFVHVRRDAPEQQRLVDAGVPVGLRRTHPGQGTRNVCFSFADSYLELLWIDDEGAAQSATSAPLRLIERNNWRQSQASPFGICLRGDGDAPPFEHWHYRPEYLPKDMSIAIANGSDSSKEPMLFQLDRTFEPFGEAHALSKLQLHSVVLTTPNLSDTSPLSTMRLPRFLAVEGEEHLLTISLQDARGNVGDRQLDLRPDLPVSLHW